MNYQLFCYVFNVKLYKIYLKKLNIKMFFSIFLNRTYHKCWIIRRTVHIPSFHLHVRATRATSASCQLIDLSGIIIDVVLKISNFEDSN
jgi:hypothetical protein